MRLVLVAALTIASFGARGDPTASAHADPARTPPTPSFQFTNVTQAAGITHLYTPPEPFGSPGAELDQTYLVAGGAAAEDFDGDGWIDLFVLGGGAGPTLLYMNNQDGTFTDRAADWGIDFVIAGGKAAAAADYDNDGDVDVCVTTQQAPHLLFINDGEGAFSVDSTMLTQPPVHGSSASWGDVDNDGLLELAIGAWPASQVPPALSLFRNLGGGILEPYEFRTSPFPDRYVFTPRFADVNSDRLVDLLVVCDFQNTRLYLNVGDGMFTDSTVIGGPFTDENGMGSAVGDYDNDGDLDWFVSSIYDDVPPEGNWGITGNRLYRNRGDGSFADVTDGAGVRDGSWGWGSAFGDLDNDGDLDLYHVNGWPSALFPEVGAQFNDRPARLFANLGDGTFEEVAAAAGADDRGQGRGLILLDYDNDGDLDIFICQNIVMRLDGVEVVRDPAPPSLLRNDLDNDNHWLKVTLNGTPPHHSAGIGARVFVSGGGRTQMRELHASTNFMAQGPGRIAHFGLGATAGIDEVRVLWPNGRWSFRKSPPVDTSISISSPNSGTSGAWKTYP